METLQAAIGARLRADGGERSWTRVLRPPGRAAGWSAGYGKSVRAVTQEDAFPGDGHLQAANS